MKKSHLIEVNLAGQLFGHLISLGRSARTDGNGLRSFERVRCSCGSEKEVYVYSLVHGRTKSCGCQRSKFCRAAKIRHGHSATGATRTYRAWASMFDRCFNPNNQRWLRYGGRGITICDRWREKFENFLADMGDSPGSGYQLDRRNNDGNYTPENCRWIPARANQNNKSKNHNLEALGRRMTLAQWARWSGINTETIRSRIKRGWSVERAVTDGATMQTDLNEIHRIASGVNREDHGALRRAIDEIVRVCDARLLDQDML